MFYYARANDVMPFAFYSSAGRRGFFDEECLANLATQAKNLAKSLTMAAQTILAFQKIPFLPNQQLASPTAHAN